MDRVRIWTAMQLLWGISSVLSHSSLQEEITEKWQHHMVSTSSPNYMPNISGVHVSTWSFYCFPQSMRFLARLSSLCRVFLVPYHSNLKLGESANHSIRVFSMSHFMILMEDPILSSTFIAQYSTRLHLIRYRNVCSQIHRGGWEGRDPILLLFHRIRRKSQGGSPCALAHWWPWLLCYIWACHWDRLPFHHICFVLSFLLLLGFLKLWYEAAIRMSHVIFNSYITVEN